MKKVWGVVGIAVLAFVIFTGAQCYHENKLEEAYDDAEAVKDYLETLIHAGEKAGLDSDVLSVYRQLQAHALRRYWDAAFALADFRQSRWWDQSGPVEPVR